MSTAPIANSVDQELKEANNNVPWYSNDVPTISTEARELLEKYSGLASEDVEQHIVRIVSFVFCKDISLLPQEAHTG